MPAPLRLALALACALVGSPSIASAQDAGEATAGDASEGLSRTGETEATDTTRLDVERLPAEAITITRDLYAHGFFVEGTLGARGFIGGVGRVSDPGFWMALRVGYELLDWLWVSTVFEASIHQTNAPAPPARAVFELLGALGEVRLQANPSAELAMWLGGQVGFVVASTDVLTAYGMQAASSVGIAYGGELGIEGHFHSRHLSLGALAGVRMAPSLDGFSDVAVGIHGGPYLRCVF